MEETKIWAKAITIIISFFILCVSGCNMHLDYRISKAIEQGNDPILCRVAFGDATSNDRLAYIVAKAANNK